MPSATQQPKEKDMASDVIAPGGADEGSERPRPPQQPTSSTGGGFFHIYKSGQGYWTRMGTIAGSGLIGILTANFIYSDLRPRIPYLEAHHGWALGVALIFLAVYALFVFWFTNRPTSADFLIATDSEMKKVNWTSRKELLGS